MFSKDDLLTALSLQETFSNFNCVAKETFHKIKFFKLIVRPATAQNGVGREAGPANDFVIGNLESFLNCFNCYIILSSRSVADNLIAKFQFGNFLSQFVSNKEEIKPLRDLLKDFGYI